jgi:hypothetical protein
VRYCFDTSGINRLLDDPARDAIVTALLDTGSVQITAYNVIEAAKTEDVLRRRSLVNFMRKLSDYKRPIDRPNTLARSVARGYATRSRDGSASFSVNTDPNLDGVWVALNEPEELDEETRAEVLEWSQQWEDDYDSIAIGARARFQALIAKYPKAQRPTVAFTVRSFIRQRDQIYKGLVAPIYQKETGTVLTEEGFEEMMDEPLWSLYLGGYAYALHQRSVKVNGYSRHRNAGGIDLGQAVYLRLCDQFVTDDRAQYRGLRFLNRFARKKGYLTEVLTYDAYRRRLLPFG